MTAPPSESGIPHAGAGSPTRSAMPDRRGAAGNSPVAAPHQTWERWLAPLALLYGAFVFLPMLRNSFWADDFGWVSRAMDALHHPGLWLAPAKTDFRPLANLSFLLNFALSGLHPAGYYAFNLALHLAVVTLVMALARRVTGSQLAAGVAGLLFAGAVGNFGEAILWICGRTGPIADLFTLGALIFHWDALERGRPRDRMLALTCFALALLAKESAVVLLPLLLLMDWMRGTRVLDLITRRRRLYTPYLLLLAGYLVFQFMVLRAGSPILQSEYVVGPHAFFNLLEYLVRMVLPLTPTSLLMPVPAALRPMLHSVFALLMAGIPLLWLMLALRPGTPRVIRFGILWMVITLLPYVFFTYRTSARYLYTPAIGLALVLGSWAAAWWDRAGASPGGAAARRRFGIVLLIVVLGAQALVMEVIIHRRHVEQTAQDPALYRGLTDHARALGLR